MSVSVLLWGTRGSIASPGPETSRYGGNTACVEVRADTGTVLILDAGTGIRRLGSHLGHNLPRVDVLLTHLHMDHIQGLGFFGPIFDPATEVHIYGPATTTLSLRERLSRYLSPPLFPVHLRDLLGTLHFHEIPTEEFSIGPFRIATALVCHPNPTVGFRISTDEGSLAYLPDHEPTLGLRNRRLSPEWTSGYSLAAGCDLLLHDAQYTDEEYEQRVGWGHSSMRQAIAYAEFVGARRLVPFHHDPAHSDDIIDSLIRETSREASPALRIERGMEGAEFQIP